VNENVLLGGFAVKVGWKGVVVSVQPRIRLTRSFDERNHSYLGYALRISGTVGDTDCEFTVGLGKAAQAKHQFQVGNRVSGQSEWVPEGIAEVVELYKTSGLKRHHGSEATPSEQPPWHGVTPDLQTYRRRGHRRLDTRTYRKHCRSCIWGCEMPVELIVDHWKPHVRRFRSETFCYGPKSCSVYRPGPKRVVPGRKGMSWEEPDWVDEEATAHRGPDE
jgi:hypothetical protein